MQHYLSESEFQEKMREVMYAGALLPALNVSSINITLDNAGLVKHFQSKLDSIHLIKALHEKRY